MDKKSRVLCIVQLPPPVHGVSIMNSYLVNSEKMATRFDFDVVSLKFGRTIGDLNGFAFRKVLKAVGVTGKIIAKMCRRRYSLIYFTLTPTGFGFYRDAVYVLLLKLFRTPVLLHLHGKGVKEAVSGRWSRLFYRLVFHRTHIICLSERLKEDVADVYSGDPFVVPNGIPMLPATQGMPRGYSIRKPKLLYLSNLMRNKGIEVLVEALSILHAEGLSFQARLVGAPADVTLEELGQTVDRFGLSQSVTIVGPTYGDEKIFEFQSSDVFVFPTYNDAFPLVNIEAMQFGLPVVSTDEGSIPDVVVHNETGLIAEKGNVHSLVENLRIILRQPERGRQMGLNGRRRFEEHFTITHFEERMLSIFSILCGGGFDKK